MSNLRSTQSTSRFSRTIEGVDGQKGNRLEPLHSNDVGGSSSFHFAYCIPQFGRRSFVNTKPNLGSAATDRRITTGPSQSMEMREKSSVIACIQFVLSVKLSFLRLFEF